MSADPFADHGIDWAAFDPDAAVATARGSTALTPALSGAISAKNKHGANDDQKQQPEAKRFRTAAGRIYSLLSSATIVSDWSALPADLIRRVGQLQNDPRSLAGMERTCKSWREVVAEGNDYLSVNLGVTCLWRDLALAEHPVLLSIANVLEDEREIIEESFFTWKSLFRLHRHTASKSAGTLLFYQPKTQMRDYIFTTEFRSADTFLFSTSARGMHFPELWEQETERGTDGDCWISCVGKVDSDLQMRLGDQPFGKKQLNEMTARVVVTRISDMALAELASNVPIEKYGLKHCGRIDFHCHGSLPVERIIINKDEVHDFSRNCLMADEYSLELNVVLDPENGEVEMAIDRVNHSGGDSARLFPHGILMYLEVQCPWVKRSR